MWWLVEATGYHPKESVATSIQLIDIANLIRVPGTATTSSALPVYSRVIMLYHQSKISEELSP
jgi:hypothetical protein